MAIAAGVAAGVAVAATAASTALKATQGGPDLPGAAAVGSQDPREAQARREHFDILRQGRQYAERGAYEQNLLTPDLYRMAGFEPQYDEQSFGAASAARAASDQANQEFTDAQANRDQFFGAGGKKTRQGRLAGLKGKARKQALKQFRQDKRAAAQRFRQAKQGRDSKLEAAGQAESQAGRITGLKMGRLGTTQEQEFEDTLEQRALDAAKTGRSTDPRLNRELDEQEGDIRARLARQFGPDYENTTAGAMALNAFRQRKSESLADFARRDIDLAGEALRHRATLGNIAVGRMGLAQEPVAGRYREQASMGELADSYGKFESMLMKDRLHTEEVNRQNKMEEYAANRERTEAIAGGLSQLGQTASSFGMASMSYAGGSSASGVPGYSNSLYRSDLSNPNRSAWTMGYGAGGR